LLQGGLVYLAGLEVGSDVDGASVMDVGNHDGHSVATLWRRSSRRWSRRWSSSTVLF